MIKPSEICRHSKNFRVAVAHEEMNPRKRNTMEDVHRMLPQLGTDENISFFGVYDGHGGRQIVNFLEPNLESNIAKELNLPDDAEIPERLARAFLITDMQSRQLERNTAGATAVVALIKREDTVDGNFKRTLYVGNVGDSRAVLVCKNATVDSVIESNSPMNSDDDSPTSSSKKIKNTHGYYARRLTYDHRAEDESEQRRVVEAGGFITRGRILGILAVSRSFGDHGMKDFVIADPYLTTTILNHEDDTGPCPMLILACDGVWDVFSDQEAVNLLMNAYIDNHQEPFENAAQLLVTEAISRGSADNVTAIVVFL